MSRVRGWAVAAAVVVAATACSSNSNDDGPAGAKTWDQANAEYLAETKELTLPAGLAFPTKIPRPRTVQGTPTSFGDGVGRGAADSLWYCGWENSWLKHLSAGSPEAASDLATMRGLTKLSMYTQSTLPSDRHIYTDAWARAELGDPSLIQQDFTANCDIHMLGGS